MTSLYKDNALKLGHLADSGLKILNLLGFELTFPNLNSSKEIAFIPYA